MENILCDINYIINYKERKARVFFQLYACNGEELFVIKI